MASGRGRGSQEQKHTQKKKTKNKHHCTPCVLPVSCFIIVTRSCSYVSSTSCQVSPTVSCGTRPEVAPASRCLPSPGVFSVWPREVGLRPRGFYPILTSGSQRRMSRDNLSALREFFIEITAPGMETNDLMCQLNHNAAHRERKTSPKPRLGEEMAEET